MIHFKGDQRTLYEDCQRFVDALSIEDKARNEHDWRNNLIRNIALHDMLPSFPLSPRLCL